MLGTLAPSALAPLADSVIDLALASRTSPAVRKKALMCVARFIRREPARFDVKKFFGAIGDVLEGRGGLSLASAGASLLLTVMGASNPDWAR